MLLWMDKTEIASYTMSHLYCSLRAEISCIIGWMTSKSMAPVSAIMTSAFSRNIVAVSMILSSSSSPCRSSSDHMRVQHKFRQHTAVFGRAWSSYFTTYCTRSRLLKSMYESVKRELWATRRGSKPLSSFFGSTSFTYVWTASLWYILGKAARV